mgnify:CR=1 FL=1|tara:strand:+ start:79 stop:504 length:426 start_codon:yes stop_codon:yes gene_type:complete
MIEKISHKKKVFGYLLRYKKKLGVNFLTPKNLTHQIGFIKHKSKHLIKPHKHYKNIRRIEYTSEVLILLKGKLRVDFYSNKEKYLFSKIIKKNDIIILNSGGHGFKVLETVEMIEVKQGPYNTKSDKKVFDKVNDSAVKIK